MNLIIKNLTDSNFNKEISNLDNKKKEIFLIDFWAEWCNPCKMMASILEEIAIEYKNKIKVAKINIDENPIVTKNYNIKSIPTLILLKDNIVLSTKIGLLSKQQLQEFLNIYTLVQ